jgi:hypothetical protein
MSQVHYVQIIACRIYDGLLTLIEYEHGKKNLKVNEMRFEDVNIIDLTFLHGYGRSTVRIYADDARSCRQANSRLHSSGTSGKMSSFKDGCYTVVGVCVHRTRVRRRPIQTG